MEADQLEVSNDSQLVVKQIEDSYEARGEKMILYLKKVRELLKKFIRAQVKHVPRVENSRADALAKLATTSQEDLGRLIPVEHLPEPSVSIDNREVSPVMSEPSWMDPIWDYLVDGTLPSIPKEASKLRARSVRFTVHRGTIICRFEISRSLVYDNGKQFDNPKFRDLCAELEIKNYYSSPAHLQSNGQVEVTIRTLKAALKTKLEYLKGKWVEYLPEVL